MEHTTQKQHTKKQLFDGTHEIKWDSSGAGAGASLSRKDRQQPLVMCL